MMTGTLKCTRNHWVSAWLLILTSPFALSTQAADNTLTIGSTAPALDIQHWVQDGKGKFKHVTNFEKGKVYILEFWATWCGPCIASMPHLSQTQDKYASRGVQLISISDEERDVVDKFLDGKVRRDPSKTYRELTSNYCLTTDPDASSHESYFQAAGQTGIPCAFIVGKDSKVEWIGHPSEMDEPLNAVLDGKWDREKFGQEFRENKLIENLMDQINLAAARNDAKRAIHLIDSNINQFKSPVSLLKIKVVKLQLMLQSNPQNSELAGWADQVLKDAAQFQPSLVNDICWNTYQVMMETTVNQALLKRITAAVTENLKRFQGEDLGVGMDTLAHLLALAGDYTKAIQTQEEAIALVGSSSSATSMKDYLRQLKKEAAAKK